jgi:hypothetical protein
MSPQTHLSSLSCCVLMLLLPACAHVVYKDSVTTYVSSGQKLVKQLNDTSHALIAAEDQDKITSMADDLQCPIGQPRVFVREQDHKANGTFDTALSDPRLESLKEQPKCKALLACELSKNPMGVCTRRCYTADEGLCIINLQNDLSILRKASPDDAALTATEDSFKRRVHQIEFGAVDAYDNHYVTGSITALSSYMGLLSKLAEDRNSEIPSETAKATETVKTVVDELSKLKPLSSSNAAKVANGKTALDAIAKLLGDLQDMKYWNDQVSKIKDLVRERQSDVTAVIDGIQPFAEGDAELLALAHNLAAEAQLAALEDSFKTTTTTYRREALIFQRTKYAPIDEKALQKSIDDVFKEFDLSSTSLADLIEHPTDEQKKALQSERFNNFKAAIEDAASVVTAVTKF